MIESEIAIDCVDLTLTLDLALSLGQTLEFIYLFSIGLFFHWSPQVKCPTDLVTSSSRQLTNCVFLAPSLF